MADVLKSKQLRQQRAKLVADAQEILKADKISTEDRTKFDTMMADADVLKADIDRHERSEAEARSLATAVNRNGSENKQAEGTNLPEEERKINQAFDKYLRFGLEGMAPEEKAVVGHRFVDRNGERRAMTVTTTAGGYLIPVGFQAELDKALLQFGGIRQAARVITTESGNALHWPTVNDTGNKGELLAINTGAASQDVAVGEKIFNAYKFSSKLVLVPIELLQDSAFDLNSYLAQALGERIGRIQADYWATGTGSSQPQGITVGGTSAFTAALASAVSTDELTDLVHSIDPAYRQMGCSFVFNDTVLKALKKLKDGQNRPLWTPGIAYKEPDTLLGYPYLVDQSMPAMTTGLKPIAFGQMKKFIIRDVMGVSVLRLNELYAVSGQVGFLAFARADGGVVDAGTHPIKFVTMA
jgi:HK97 family phage major capsid protein